MHSPLERDVLKELTSALHEAGMQVMFHFSILDTHHDIRPTMPFTPEKMEFIKSQLRELLTSYGPVNTIMFDGWDAPWGRISYSDISFPEIYSLIKGLQRTWFWKESFPTDQLKDIDTIVRENIIPYNKAYCTFILNAAPNREGLIDANAVSAMQRIGQIWKNTGHIVDIPMAPDPIININLAIGRKCYSSWSDDMMLMDFANDDNFSSCWVSNPTVKNPWWMVELDRAESVSKVVVTEGPHSA